MVEYNYRVPMHLKIIYLVVPIWIYSEIDYFVSEPNLKKYLLIAVLACAFAWAVVMIFWKPNLIIDDEYFIIPSVNLPFSKPMTIRLVDIKQFKELDVADFKEVIISHSSGKISIYESYLKFKSYIVLLEFDTQLEHIIHSIKVARVKAKKRLKEESDQQRIIQNSHE